MNRSSKSARIALFAAALAVACWAGKAVAIGMAGGLDKSPAEGPLFFAGLIALVVGVVSLGVALTRGRPAWLRAVGAAIAFVTALGVTTAVGSAFAALQPAQPSWVWSEVELWVVAPLALLAAWAVSWRRVA